MKKRLTVFLALFMTVMCSITMALPAYAAELAGVTVPVKITLSGTLPSTEENFKVVLKADEKDYPMPKGAVNGTCYMTITGADTEYFPTITYDRVGVYTYTIYQVAGTNKKCKYDDTVYSLTVTVSNKADYSGLEVTAVLNSDSGENKLILAEFKNKYKVVPPSYGPKTGDESTPWLYVLLIVVCMGVIVALFVTRKSKKMDE